MSVEGVNSASHAEHGHEHDQLRVADRVVIKVVDAGTPFTVTTLVLF
jgi:hypothetical protein